MVSASGSRRGLGGRDRVVGVLAAPALLGDATADEVDQRRLQHPVRLPELGVRDAVDAGPHLRVGQVLAPVGPHVLRIEILHGGREPGPDVHAVGDVPDRHLVLAVVRPEHLPRLAGDPAVQRRDAVGVAGHLERQHRHAERLAVVVGADAAEAQEVGLRQPQRAAQRLQVIVDQLGREAVMTGVDRRVGGEHRALRDLLRAGAEVGPGLLHQEAGVLQGGEGAVPLVEVQAPPVDAGRAQRADAAHAEEQLLPDADPLIAEVEAGRQLPVLLGVAVDVGVEEQELVPSDRDLPDLRQQRLARERHLDDDRLAGRGEGGPGGEQLRGRADVLGVLPAVAADVLPEVRLPVEEAHRDQRQPQVGGALEVVTGQDAEAPRIDGQRLVDAELRREIGDRADPERPGVDRGPGAGGAQVFAQLPVGAVDPRPQAGVARQVLQAIGRKTGQHRDGVVVRRAEAVRIEVPEQLDDVGVPGPPQVDGEILELTE